VPGGALLARLERRGPLFWSAAGVFGIAGIGVADVATGPEFSFGLFYLFPIVLATRFAGRNAGLAMSVLAACMWFIADDIGGRAYSHPGIRFWNAAVRFGFFTAVTLLLPALKALEHEREVSRTDQLTGAANRRHFFEALQAELYRSVRYGHPLTIAYIDLDAFKAMNDEFGHRTGDRILRAVVESTKSHLRKSDLMARLGGDEFVLLLPEIDCDAARLIVPKIHSALLTEMQRNKWPVTFSIGVYTSEGGSITADEMLRQADDLMYSVKRHGRGGIAFASGVAAAT
jgi:diguanylate cyclase (GGDEF)-like protein